MLGNGSLSSGTLGDSSTASRKRPRFATQSSTTTAVCFEKFRDEKHKERTSRFKKKQGSSEGKSEKKVAEVNIQIGFMKLRDGDLKIVRGSTLPLKVLPTIGSIELRMKSTEKMIKFNKDIHGDPDKFTLVYPDRTEVKFLPGSSEMFTLVRYKEELGKAYARITLYLCKTCEYFEAMFSETVKLWEEADDFEDSLNFNELMESGLEHLNSNEENNIEANNCSTDVHTEVRSEPQNDSLADRVFGIETSNNCSTDVVHTHVNDMGSEPQNDSLPGIILDEIQVQNIPEDTTNLPVKNVLLHRAMIKEEIIRIFMDPEVLVCNVNVKFIGDDGNEEAGAGVGVLRDALTSFWAQFFNSLSVGSQEKVPAIRHDFQKMQWEAIARILVYGFVREGYFPLPLSRGFLASCLFGEEAISKEYLLDSFRPYISEDERDALEKCLSDNWVPDDEDVLDFLSNYQCFRTPRKENILQIVYELAHKELIQKPKYIMHCWAPIVRLLMRYPDFITLEGLQSIYDVKRPTAKKVVKLIMSEPQSDAQRQCLDYLKKYIRSLQGVTLALFLRFVTGSDVMVCKAIDVSFTNLEGTARRPIVHTCGPVLELPSTYQSYNELSEEFSELIHQKDSWEFNIV